MRSGIGNSAQDPLYVTGSAPGTTLPDGSTSQPVSTQATPSGAVSAAPFSGQSTVAEGSRILKASAGNLYGYDCCSGASAGYLMVFDSTTVPADGAVTPKRVHAIAANASLSRSFNPPIRCATGIVLVFSTTGAFSKTISATAFLAGDYV